MWFTPCHGWRTGPGGADHNICNNRTSLVNVMDLARLMLICRPWCGVEPPLCGRSWREDAGIEKCYVRRPSRTAVMEWFALPCMRVSRGCRGPLGRVKFHPNALTSDLDTSTNKTFVFRGFHVVRLPITDTGTTSPLSFLQLVSEDVLASSWSREFVSALSVRY